MNTRKQKRRNLDILKRKVFAFVATVAISTMIMSEVLLIMHFKNEQD